MKLLRVTIFLVALVIVVGGAIPLSGLLSHNSSLTTWFLGITALIIMLGLFAIWTVARILDDLLVGTWMMDSDSSASTGLDSTVCYNKLSLRDTTPSITWGPTSVSWDETAWGKQTPTTSIPGRIRDGPQESEPLSTTIPK